jgi:hypothetical protein
MLVQWSMNNWIAYYYFNKVVRMIAEDKSELEDTRVQHVKISNEEKKKEVIHQIPAYRRTTRKLCLLLNR